MIPICYEESIVSGAGLPCADFMAIATETFVKEVLSVVFSRTSATLPTYTSTPTVVERGTDFSLESTSREI